MGLKSRGNRYYEVTEFNNSMFSPGIYLITVKAPNIIRAKELVAAAGLASRGDLDTGYYSFKEVSYETAMKTKKDKIKYIERLRNEPVILE